MGKYIIFLTLAIFFDIHIYRDLTWTYLSPDLSPIKHVLATIERCVVPALTSRHHAFVAIKTALQKQLLALSASLTIARLIISRVIICVILLLAVNVCHIKDTSHVTNLHLFCLFYL